MFEDASARSPRACSGWQQKGSKRVKSRLRNRAASPYRRRADQQNRAIARRSSSIVVSMEQACHAGAGG